MGEARCNEIAVDVSTDGLVFRVTDPKGEVHTRSVPHEDKKKMRIVLRRLLRELGFGKVARDVLGDDAVRRAKGVVYDRRPRCVAR